MTEYREEDFLMLSGIQHFAFCRRQWALIHIEDQWQENEHTVMGDLFHRKAHDPYVPEKRKDTIISRSIPVHSRSMGVSGSCDIVEFHKSELGVALHGHRGLFDIFPVEYKKGKPKANDADILQLTAQAMCLEEMLSADIKEGALFYGETRRREVIIFTEELRSKVRGFFQEMHELYRKRYTPKVKWSKGCSACSMKDICLPKLGKNSNVREYITRTISEEST